MKCKRCMQNSTISLRLEVLRFYSDYCIDNKRKFFFWFLKTFIFLLL